MSEDENRLKPPRPVREQLSAAGWVTVDLEEMARGIVDCQVVSAPLGVTREEIARQQARLREEVDFLRSWSGR